MSSPSSHFFLSGLRSGPRDDLVNLKGDLVNLKGDLVNLRATW